MIIKIEAVPKLTVEDGVEKVVMGENNQPVWDRERALITTKGGNYRRIVTLTNWRQRWQKDTDTSMQ